MPWKHGRYQKIGAVVKWVFLRNLLLILLLLLSRICRFRMGYARKPKTSKFKKARYTNANQVMQGVYIDGKNLVIARMMEDEVLITGEINTITFT